MNWSMSEELAKAQRELEEKKLRHNAVTAADAVVSKVFRSFWSFILKAIGLVIFFVIICGAVQTPTEQTGMWVIFSIVAFCYLVYRGIRHIQGPKDS